MAALMALIKAAIVIGVALTGDGMRYPTLGDHLIAGDRSTGRCVYPVSPVAFDATAAQDT